MIQVLSCSPSVPPPLIRTHRPCPVSRPSLCSHHNRHSQTSSKICFCGHHRHTRHSDSLSFHKVSSYSHSQSSQNVGFCRDLCRDHRHIQSSCKVCYCLFRSIHKVYLSGHCHSQSFCKFCAMCPPSAVSSAHKQKLRVLCLHGFRTNGSIMKTQLAKLDRSVLDLLDMVFLDAPYAAAGESDVEGFFPPPYYEWFQFEKTETGVNYTNLEECIQYISDFMEAQGPFDGLIGFSQGSFLSAALAGMQQQGLALTSIPALRFVLIISGGVLDGEHEWKGCYSKPIRCPSLHLIGANDFLKPRNEELVLKFEDPVVIRHGAKHTVPRLDERAALPIKIFLEDVVSTIREQKDHVIIREQNDHSTDWTFASCPALA